MRAKREVNEKTCRRNAVASKLHAFEKLTRPAENKY